MSDALASALQQAIANKSVISTELANSIDIPLDFSGRIPCDPPRSDGARSCVQAQLEPANGERKGWHELDPKKMCASCACHWHLSCARNYALGVMR